MTDTVDEDFSEYVAARQRSLIQLAYLLVGDFHAAEDIVQSALARTYRSWRRIRDRGALDAYVRKAVVNEHTNWWRRAHRRMERSTDRLPDQPVIESGLDGADADELRHAIRALPPRQRAVLVLRYYEQLTEVETAAVMDCAVGTVKSQSSRALAALRGRLEERPSVAEGPPRAVEGTT